MYVFMYAYIMYVYIWKHFCYVPEYVNDIYIII